MIRIDFSDKEFRRLLDLVYIGNWVLNSIRGNDRFTDYDVVESKVFAHCANTKMRSLFELVEGEVLPSTAYEEGGIHEAIMEYEDTVFFEILAEELSRRDMDAAQIRQDDQEELITRMNEYMLEFEQNGVENLELER